MPPPKLPYESGLPTLTDADVLPEPPQCPVCGKRAPAVKKGPGTLPVALGLAAVGLGLLFTALAIVGFFVLLVGIALFAESFTTSWRCSACGAKRADG